MNVDNTALLVFVIGEILLIAFVLGMAFWDTRHSKK